MARILPRVALDARVGNDRRIDRPAVEQVRVGEIPAEILRQQSSVKRGLPLRLFSPNLRTPPAQPSTKYLFRLYDPYFSVFSSLA